MNFLLKAKHWQLFVLTIGVPTVLWIVMIISLIAGGGMLILPIVGVAFLIGLGIQFSWNYTVGVSLYPKLPEGAKMNLTLFKVFFFIPLVYFFALFFGGIIFFVTMLSHKSENFLLLGMIWTLLIPIHLFSMFCLFYCLYFLSKTLKAVQLQRSVSLEDYIGEFFLLWFFPIGIWIIQPKINKIFDGSDEELEGTIFKEVL